MKNNFEFHIISMSTYGIGLSGGDRIFIEISKVLSKKYQLKVYLWEEGFNICQREGLKQVKYIVWSAKFWTRFGFFINYFARIFIALFASSKLKLANDSCTVVYSASEFWQDSLPSLLLKIKYPKITWIAAWYQTAPNPFTGYSEGNRVSRYKFKAFLYWFVQLPIKPLIKKFATIVIVNNENEKKEFPEMTKENKVFVMLGAVDIEKIKKYQVDHKTFNKVYNGVFQGRFHPQKGVLELIDIWKIVTRSKPKAKLAMIGDGPLMNDILKKINIARLEKNIKLFGYIFDGPKKYKIFSQSEIVLHPAFYDSGGMASAEAMAFGLPAIGFDLKSYKSYYPYGLIKVKTGDLDAFANQVIALLDNPLQRDKIGSEGVKMIESNWSWRSRASDLLYLISSLL